MANTPSPPADEPTTANDVPRRWTTPQVLLGLLVIWQIIFLLSANTLNVLSSIRRITGENSRQFWLVLQISSQRLKIR
jgi:hypothetical protein